MTNYKRTLELVEIAQDSQGRSSEQFAKYADSIEYKLKKLKNTWEQFRIGIADSSFYGKVLENANNLLSKITEFDTFDWAKWATIFLTIGRYAGQSLMQGLKETFSLGSVLMNNASIGIGKALGNSTSGSSFLGGIFGVRTEEIEKINAEWTKAKEELQQDWNTSAQQQAKAYQETIRQQTYAINATKADIEKDKKFVADSQAELQRLESQAAKEAAQIRQGIVGGNKQSPIATTSSTEAARLRGETNLASWRQGLNEERLAQQEAELEHSRALQQTYQKEALEDEKTYQEESAKIDQAYMQKRQEEYAKQGPILQAQMRAAGAAAATALTTAFIAVATEENPIEVAGTIWKTTALAMIPQLVMVFTTTLQTTMKASDAILATSKTALIITGIVAAVSLLAAAFKWASNEIKQSREDTAKANSEFYATQKQIEELEKKETELGQKAHEATQSFKELNDEYKSLTENGEQLKELADKLVLTTEEQEKLNKLSNEMAELFPELVDGYDAEGNAVINLADNYEQLVQAKKDALDLAALEQSKAALDVRVNEYEQALNRYYGSKDLAEKIQQTAYQSLINTTATRLDIPLSKMEQGQLLSQGAATHTYATGIGNNTKIVEEQYNLTDFSPKAILKMMANVDKLAYGAELSEILKNTTFQLPKENDKVIKAILSELENDTEGKKLEEFKNAFDKYSQVYNSNVKALASTRTEVQNAASTYIGDYLTVTDSKYKGLEDKNAQQALRNFALQQIGLDFSDIEKNYGREKYETTEKWQEAIDSAINDIIVSNKNKIDTSKFKDSWISTYEAISKAISDKKSIKDIVDIAYAGFGGTDEYQRFLEQYGSQIDKYNENMTKIAEKFGIKGTLSKAASGIIEDSGSIVSAFANAGSSAQDAFLESFDKAEKQGIQDLFIKTAESLVNKGVNLGEIFNYNWENTTYANIDDASEYFADKFGEENSEVILDFAKKFKLVDLSNPDLEAFKQQLSETTSGIESLTNAYSSVMKNYKDKGYLSYSDIESLEKAGVNVSDYIDENLRLDEEGLKKFVYEQIDSQEALNQAVIDEAKGRLQTLKTLKASQGALVNLTALQKAYNTAVKDENADVLSDFESIKERLENEGSTAALDEAIENQEKYLEGLLEISDSEALKRKALSEAAKREEEELANTASAVEKAKEAYEKAAESVTEKQEQLIEKQKELNKLLYGSDTYKSKLDSLYNYQTALDRFKTTIEDVKETLEDLDGESPAELIDQWLGAAHSQSAYLLAENSKYNNAIKNTESMLRNQLTNYMLNSGRGANFNVSDYYSYNSVLDRYVVNQQKLNQVKMNDQLKDFIGEQVDLMNTYKNNIKNNQDEIKKLDKDWTEYLRQARDNYISVQDEVVEKLKESYEKEVDDKEKLYDSLKEADDKYLEALQKAIDKEKKLRDQQDKWNSLSEKEKRLSLLQRDTSGAQQKETLKLQRDIEKERTDLLDTSISNVIDELKEFYETQQETREQELEYQKSILDNSNLIVEANAIMQSWKSMDEMVAWMYDHTTDIENMSDEAVEKLTDDWKEMFNNIQIYNEVSQKKIQDFYTTNTTEIQKVLNSTTETLTSEAQRAFKETSQAVTDSITTAEKAVTEAMTAIKEAEEELIKTQKEYNALLDKMKGKGGSLEGAPNSGDIPESIYSITDSSNLTGPAKDAYTVAIEGRKWDKSIQDMFLLNKYESQELVDLYKEYKDLEEALNNSKTMGERERNKQDLDNFLFNHKAYKIDDSIYTDEEATAQLYHFMTSTYGKGQYSIFDFLTGEWKRYATGGLVDYTGPAWVDGSKSDPELLLSPEDTKRIGNAAQLLANLPFFKSDGSIYQGTTTVGDTNVELHIHVDSIATEGQVDYLINRIKTEIVDAANPIGTPVIAY